MSIDVSSLGPSIVLKWASGMQNVQSIIASIGTASNYLQAAAFTALSVVWVLQQCIEPKQLSCTELHKRINESAQKLEKMQYEVNQAFRQVRCREDEEQRKRQRAG